MCEVCLGRGCPYCWPPQKECERCLGGGRIYYIVDPDTDEQFECSKEEWERTPFEYRWDERCPDCDGEGFIDE